MSKEFIGKTFPDSVMPTPSGEGVGVETSNGVEVRDAGSAGKRTPNDHLDVDEVTTVRVADAPGQDERVSLNDQILTSPAMRKGLIL